MKPLIAIVPDVTGTPTQRMRGLFCETTYTEAIQAAGGLPFILPATTETEPLDHFLRLCHGLLLIGGGDLTNPYYARRLSDAERATLSGLDAERDAMEIYLVREALDIGLPVLGICRGMQVLNVAANGTLIPDLPIARPDAICHRRDGAEAIRHPVVWDASTRLGDILGDGCEQVNSTHHQAVDDIAPGFEVAARAPDGIIEAIEKSGPVFVTGVQFHPERLFESSPQFLRLFEAFVAGARHRM